MSEEDRLAQALEILKADNRADAQKIVAEVILANKDNVRAWILMAKIVEDPQKAIQCWQQVARLKPNDPRVQQEIAQLKGEPMPQPQPSTQPPGIPPAQTITPVGRKRGIRLPLLIGGSVALIVVVFLVVLVIANMTPQSNPNHQSQAASATGAVTTVAEQNRPTGTLVPATATNTEQNRSTIIPASAITATPELNFPTATPATATIAPTATPHPAATNTPIPGDTPDPTAMFLPPTATQPSPLFKPGTYLVGVDIAPGIYKGEAGSNPSCYWARFEDASEILVDNDSIGQFYVEVRSSDYALETQCEVIPLDSVPASTGGFPQIIKPGMYLVGRDIQAGTYKGQAGDDFCYWERLSDVSGELDSIIDNDYVVGEFYVQVAGSDFALSTTCVLERVED